jgi:DNA-binding CsgD family transcriptional regulator
MESTGTPDRHPVPGSHRVRVTDAQIASELYISIRTVRSHLDRIRHKTSCRRRADLTRLALTAGLV